MDIESLVAEERAKLSSKIQARRKAQEIKEQEAYENHPGTIIQKQVRASIPYILELIETFASTIKAKCEIYRPPEPKPSVLVVVRLSTTRGILFKKAARHIVSVYIGVKEHTVQSEDASTTYRNNSIIITNYCTTAESKEIPVDEWILRELAKYYAQFLERG